MKIVTLLLTLTSSGSVTLAASAPLLLSVLLSIPGTPATINLPRGLEAPAAPRQPVLYPFVSSTELFASDWKPLVPQEAVVGGIPPTPIATPRLPDRTGKLETSDNGPVFESVVYGTWKPDPPLQPNHFLNRLQHDDHEGSPNKTVLSGHHGGFIGHITHKQTKPNKSNKALKKHQAPEHQPNPVEQINSQSPKTEDDHQQIAPKLIEIVTNPDFVKTNVTEPTPAEGGKGKQDLTENEQFEENPLARLPETIDNEVVREETTTTEDDQNASMAPMNWPTDFINSTPEEYTTPPEPHTNEMYGSDRFEGLDGLNVHLIPPAVLKQLPKNTSRVGVPYENKSSTEESALYVPITVQEHSVGNPAEVVNIERVLCFPLPTLTTPVREVRMAHNNLTTVQGTEGKSVDNVTTVPPNSGWKPILHSTALLSALMLVSSSMLV